MLYNQVISFKEKLQNVDFRLVKEGIMGSRLLTFLYLLFQVEVLIFKILVL